MTRSARGDLSNPMRRALVIVLEDTWVQRYAGTWHGSSDRIIKDQVIESLFDRSLLRVIYESRHRTRHRAQLTQIGECAALELQRHIAVIDSEPTRQTISEQAKLMIQGAL